MPADWMICTAGRSGSTWLAEVLAGVQFLGRAEEYFNNAGGPWNEGTFAKAFGAEGLTPEAYWAKVRAEHASSEGVQGVKVAFRDYELVRDAIHPTHAIRLVRRNRIAQAVSLHRAVDTGVWTGDGSPPEFRLFRVLQLLRSIIDADRTFARRLDEDQIPQLTISYESMVEFGPRWVVLRIAHHLGVPVPAKLECSWKSRIQADDWNRMAIQAVCDELGVKPLFPTQCRKTAKSVKVGSD